jgi:tRNA pseudouridine55 synthase
MSRSQRLGILNVAKPSGITSRQVVDRVARLVRPDKAGHAGTLDPLATGVLIVCVGKATRLIDCIHDLPKTYRAEFLLGRQSDTDDVTGQVVLLADAPNVTRETIEAVLPSFVGRIQQAPPRFSAVHVGGKRAYELARQGKDFELSPREVEVARIELLYFSYPMFEIAIDCGSGTYVRSLGRDIGKVLGSGAVLSALARIQIGPYRVEDAVELDDLNLETIGRHLLAPATAVEHLPKYRATVDEAALVRAGRPLEIPSSAEEAGAKIAVLGFDGELLCIAENDAGARQLR